MAPGLVTGMLEALTDRVQQEREAREQAEAEAARLRKQLASLRKERDGARSWVKLLLAPYAATGIRERARQVIAEWDATEGGE